MATRTPLFNRVQPGGVFTISDVIQHPGDIWWVNSATGTDGAGYGQNPDAPCATIDYAYNLATASQGDVIYVMPGHEETILNATTLVPDKAGISIIGLGRGSNRPIINFNHANAKLIFSGANQRMSNMVLNATITGVVLGVDITAADVEIDNCHFTWETTASEFLKTIAVTSVARAYIHDNVFDTEEGCGATDCIYIVAADDARIERNVFRGTWSAAVILGASTLSARVVIKDNVIYNSDTSNYNGIDPGAVATTGIVANNTVTALYATAVAKVIRKANLTWHDNTFANAVSKAASGQKHAASIPATSSS